MQGMDFIRPYGSVVDPDIIHPSVQYPIRRGTNLKSVVENRIKGCPQLITRKTVYTVYVQLVRCAPVVGIDHMIPLTCINSLCAKIHASILREGKLLPS